MKNDYTKEDVAKFEEVCNLYQKFESYLGTIFYVTYLKKGEKGRTFGHLFGVERFRSITMLDIETDQLVSIPFKDITSVIEPDISNEPYQSFYYFNETLGDVLDSLEVTPDKYDMEKLGSTPEEIKLWLETIEMSEFGKIVWDSNHLPNLTHERKVSRLGRKYHLDYFQEMFPKIEVIPRGDIPFIPEEGAAYRLIGKKE